MQAYVALNSVHVPDGSLLLRQRHHPYAVLTANTIGILTRKVLRAFWEPMDFWVPHTTPDAGVRMYKKIGRTSQKV